MTSPSSPLAEGDALELLTHGLIGVEGRMISASNTTLFASIALAGVEGHCIYKPSKGERPLWDFPVGTLGCREVAAYLVSAASGWDVVPPTVWREGPFGPGSVQLWVDAIDDVQLIDVVPAGAVATGWLPVVQAYDAVGDPVILVHADDPRLARMAVLDGVIDNADRKGGHVLVTEGGQVWGVDHGVSFNVDDKLRTVLWGWAGQPLPCDATDVLRALRADLANWAGAGLGAALAQLLSPAEVRKTRTRVDRLLTSGRFPRPGGHAPLIPWPPF